MRGAKFNAIHASFGIAHDNLIADAERTIILGYTVDFDSVRAALLEAMHSVPEVLAEPAPSVRVRELVLDGIHFEGRFWTDSRRSDFLATTSRVAEAAVAHLKQRGVPLPEPAERLLAPAQGEAWTSLLASSDRIRKENREANINHASSGVSHG